MGFLRGILGVCTIAHRSISTLSSEDSCLKEF